MRRLIAALAAAAAIAIPAVASPPAQAQAHSASWYGNTALDWAEAHATGHPYVYGGTGPWVYDCSGLVQQAFRHAGIQLPRTTYDMLASRHVRLFWTAHPWRGLIAFYGSGHVELVTKWWHVTFGAHDTGSAVGWIRWGSYWHPTLYGQVVP